MKNVFWVITNRLAGRCGPTSQPWILSELRAAGFTAVLNLSEHEPSQDEFAAAQLQVAWVPLPNTCPAEPATEDACLNALPQAHAFVQAHLAAGGSVLVHCALGRDRTGLLLAFHLASSAGITPEAAIARVREVCPKALSAPGWELMGIRVIARLRTHRP